MNNTVGVGIATAVSEGAAFAADSGSIEFDFKGTHRSEFDVTPECMKEGLCSFLLAISFRSRTS